MDTRPTPAGYSLLELLLALSLIAICSTLSLPSYRNALRQAARTRAQLTLETVAAQGTTPTQALRQTPHYHITRHHTRSGYTLRASPTDTQREDRCGVLSLNTLGERTGQASDCWPD